MTATLHRSSRLALASLVAVALIAYLAIGLSRSDLTVVRFFSHFAVLSNTLAVALLAMLAGRPGRNAHPRFGVFRGAVTVYMSVTALVYAFLISAVTGTVVVHEPWIDWVIHVAAPIAIALDWIADPPAVRLPAESSWIWLLFPVAYLIYSLVRGVGVDWYPYPFLDPAEEGYGAVALWCGVVLAVILAFGYAYQWWADRRLIASASA